VCCAAPVSGHDHGRHGHTGGPTAAAAHRSRLTAALTVTLTVLVAEVVGGLLAHSLVLLADAAHMAADAAGIGLSLLAVVWAARPATPRRTFGYQRAEILAAVVNALVLFAVGGLLLVEAVRRLLDPGTAHPGLMAVFGVVALVGNGFSLQLLSHGQASSLNVRGAYLEVLSDLLGAAAVLVAAAVIALSGFQRADPLASLLIALLIAPRTVRLLRNAVDVLLEATPESVDLEMMREHIEATPGVLSCHDLHAWTITSGQPVMSAHVVVDDATWDAGRSPELLDQLLACLADHLDVTHCTFQLERQEHAEHEAELHP
jgi:cobalt-zinc-cadmium efflux system protein